MKGKERERDTRMYETLQEVFDAVVLIKVFHVDMI